MLKKSLVAIALSAVTVFAIAAESDARDAAQQVIDLQDGSTLYVFKDGKMAVENHVGHAISTRPGTTLTARDGKNITLIGNEVARLNSLLQEGMEGN